MTLLIFVDESGDPLQLDEGPYILSSVAVCEDKLGVVDSSFSRFLSHINNQYGIRVNEVHAKHLVKGNSPWRLPMRDRARIFQEIAELVSRLDIVLNIVAVVKSRPGVEISKKRARGIRKHALKLLVERLYMTRADENIALIIFDSKNLREDANIRHDIEKGIEEALANPTYRTYITFSYSHLEPAIQIADYVAYLTRYIVTKQYRWQSFDFEKAFLTIEPRIRRCPGQNTYEGCGLKIWEIE